MRKVLYLIYFLLCAIAVFNGDYVTAIGLVAIGICCACLKKLFWLAVTVMLMYILWATGVFAAILSFI